MNLYEKLLTMRVELQKKDIKKTGVNTFSKYTYYELSDFMPIITELSLQNKVLSYVSFTNEVATLTLIDAEKPQDTLIFTSPMKSAELKGCHEIQNLGAVETYQRRYLYMDAFELTEKDATELPPPREETIHTQLTKKVNEASKKVGGNAFLVKRVAMDEKKIKDMLAQVGVFESALDGVLNDNKSRQV